MATHHVHCLDVLTRCLSCACAQGEVEEVGELEAAEPEEVAEPEDSSVNVLLLGPPTSGVSTQATAMGNRYSVPVVTVDELVAAGIALAETEEERASLEAMLPPDPNVPPPPEPEEPPAPAGKDAKKGGKANKGGKADKGKKGKAEEVAPEVPPGMLDPVAGGALLAATLPRALADEAYAKGVVVDGAAGCKLVHGGGAVVAEALLRAFGLQRVRASGPMEDADGAAGTGAKGKDDKKGGKDDKKGGKDGKGGKVRRGPVCMVARGHSGAHFQPATHPLARPLACPPRA